MFVNCHASLIFDNLWSGEVNSSGNDAIKLYYYLRSQDKSGRGHADINTDYLCKLFSKSRWTIQRWMRDGLSLGLFKNQIKLSPKNYRIYYASVLKIAARYGIKDLGAIFELEVSELNNIKTFAYEATAMRCQMASYNQAINDKSNKRRIKLKPEQISCETSTRAMLFSTGRFVYLRPGTLVYGASQDLIAEAAGCDISTISRNLITVPKKQQCIAATGKEELKQFQQQLFYQSEGKGSGRYHIPQFPRHPEYSKMIFKSYTNIYSSSVTLRRQRHLRWKLNKYWDTQSSISESYAQKPASRNLERYKSNLSIKGFSNKILFQLNKSFKDRVINHKFSQALLKAEREQSRIV